jgi:flagellar biosynthesis protein FlhG
MLDLSRLESVRRRALGRLFGNGSPALDGEALLEQPPRASARVVCVASGKGGTGKTVLATNLAVLRARRGERVLLVDFDAGLANAHLLLGLTPRWDLGHVMEGEVDYRRAVVEGPGGVHLLSGGVGRTVLANPTRRDLERLFRALRPAEDDYDLIVIDHGAGIGYATVAHIAATSTLVLVTSHEVTGLSDAYAVYKRSLMVNPHVRVGLVVNRAPTQEVALGAWDRFRSACQRFLVSQPEWIGWVPADLAVASSVDARVPVTLSTPSSPSAEALGAVAGWPPLDLARTSTAFYDRAQRALR